MKKIILSIVLFGALVCSAPAQQDRPLPIFPQNQATSPSSSATERAHSLYRLLKQENPGLTWDSCLATRATLRALRMVKKGYFDHEDPQTGKNPVWKSVSQCVPEGRKKSGVPAGENLAKGIDTPARIHEALMDSPTHRKNILDPRFNRVGVGCYDSICVELFLGL